jgi:transcriptional antiterminator
MLDKIFYVYQYVDDNGLPFYIGKGSKDRINESHLPWIEIPPKDKRQFIKTNMSEQEAFDFELELIQKYGRKIDGGILENIKMTRWVAQAGWKHSNETKQKISSGNLGKVRTEEQRKNYKGNKTFEHAEKVRQAVQSLWNDPVYREQRLKKIKENPFAHKGKPWSEARRKAQIKNNQHNNGEI